MKRILVVVAALVLVFVLVGFFLPEKYAVERERLVDAPRSAVFARVADLESWPRWTAWSRESDPTCEWTFGARDENDRPTRMSWKGEQLGEGRVDLTRVDAPERVEYTFTSIAGSTEMTARGSIVVETQGDGSRVSWRMEGTLGTNPAWRWAGLFMDSLLGRDFERGLAGLAGSFEG